MQVDGQPLEVVDLVAHCFDDSNKVLGFLLFESSLEGAEQAACAGNCQDGDLVPFLWLHTF